MKEVKSGRGTIMQRWKRFLEQVACQVRPESEAGYHVKQGERVQVDTLAGQGVAGWDEN